MISWLHITLMVALTGILVLLFLLIFQECFHPKMRKINVTAEDVERADNLQNGIIGIHHLDINLSKKTSPNVFRWADHPSFVTDSLENGWSRFAFTMPSSLSGSLSGVCEISWEVCEESADYMQRVRLNPGLKKIFTTVSSSVSVIRTALPLPGPHLGNSSFPQEAYFEITILPGENRETDNKENKDVSEDEKIKLIEEDFNAKTKHDFSTRNTTNSMIGKNEALLLISVGLTGGGPLPMKIPGSFPGSIGFSSTGSVYLDGTKLVSESEKGKWGRAEKVVVGCGYNPGQKRVFFTVDSKLVHEIQCNITNEEFSSPLYPTLAANADITVVVNLGQSPFKYEPANLQRTPNPCFGRSQQSKSNDLGSEDSSELFSIGRIDSQWLQRSGTRSNKNTVDSIKSVDFDLESEGDLFEINLDSTVKIPYTTTYNL